MSTEIKFESRRGRLKIYCVLNTVCCSIFSGANMLVGLFFVLVLAVRNSRDFLVGIHKDFLFDKNPEILFLDQRNAQAKHNTR